jgi:hypothetical protein
MQTANEDLGKNELGEAWTLSLTHHEMVNLSLSTGLRMYLASSFLLLSDLSLARSSCPVPHVTHRRQTSVVVNKSQATVVFIMRQYSFMFELSCFGIFGFH